MPQVIHPLQTQPSMRLARHDVQYRGSASSHKRPYNAQHHRRNGCVPGLVPTTYQAATVSAPPSVRAIALATLCYLHITTSIASPVGLPPSLSPLFLVSPASPTLQRPRAIIASLPPANTPTPSVL